MGSIGGLSPEGRVALGIMVGLVSTGVQSLGLTLQRKSHILEDEKDPCDVRRPPYRRRRWQLGMAMFIAANIFGSSVQISTLPLPVLSTLQASGLVFNSICATLILGEPFTRWSLGGTLLVCAGALLIAIFGSFPAPAHKLSELLELMGRRPFVAWMIGQAVAVAAVAAATDALSYAVFPGSQNPRFRLARGLAYGCISGVLSAHSLLVAKAAVELLIKTASDRDNQFVHWQSWLLVAVLVVLALSQLHYLHRGLKLVSTSVLYPLVFCVYNIMAILDGLIYFRQTELITPLRACLIALGTAILLAGVLALSWRLSDEQHPPAVGQSSLAPGLGLVEDTDREEDESLAGSDTLLDDEEARRASSYQTFSPSDAAPAAASAGGLRRASRFTERAEIWGELDEDGEDELPATPGYFGVDRGGGGGGVGGVRRHSTSFPAFDETAALLQPGARMASLGSVASEAGPRPTPRPRHGSAATNERVPRRMFRRRRKSTGFPGFRARSTSRRRGLQEAIGGMFPMKWFHDSRKESTSSLPDLRAEDSVEARAPLRDED